MLNRIVELSLILLTFAYHNSTNFNLHSSTKLKQCSRLRRCSSCWKSHRHSLVVFHLTTNFSIDSIALWPFTEIFQGLAFHKKKGKLFSSPFFFSLLRMSISNYHHCHNYRLILHLLDFSFLSTFWSIALIYKIKFYEENYGSNLIFFPFPLFYQKYFPHIAIGRNAKCYRRFFLTFSYLCWESFLRLHKSLFFIFSKKSFN